MSVTAPDPRRRRRLGTVAAASLLALTVSGCSGLGRTAVGPVTYHTDREAVVEVNSPSVLGCHRLDPSGARAVENGTLVDIVLYPTPDCTGGGTTYLATTFSDVAAESGPPWRSYTVVH
ncbi:hypothetical protein [Streptomyces sp. NPDC007346]|uniref:hypothetical protein n=1 Tax=Streptomyces sp. NPDC007346 TaxID=3154682 RepID=UPI003452BAEC